jgi:poly-beta-1,6-N-acetyl-D-glucosamine synthase
VRVVFWVSFATVAYTYVGYVALLAVLVRIRRVTVRKESFFPSVSTIMAARNEEANLPSKLENLRMLEYPKELMEVVVASDGSTDRTEEILRADSASVTVVVLEQPGGKARALNEAVKRAKGEILLFLDTRQYVEPAAVLELVSYFADPMVGAVSGELLLESSPSSTQTGLGLYWQIEKMVRRLESATGSVIGVTGAIYAIRRELYTTIPLGTILDDVFVPMSVVRQGRRVVFAPQAIARDRIFSEKGKEFSRKVRTLTGNYQLLRVAPWLLSFSNPVLFRFISHKLLRLLVPLLLLVMLVASGMLRGPFYAMVFWLQMLFYGLAACGAMSPSTKKFKPIGIASTFVMLNVAATIAFYNFAVGRKEVWS